MKTIRYSTLPTKSTGSIVNLADWNGGVLDNQQYLRQQGTVGWSGVISDPGNRYLVDPSTSPTWAPPYWTYPVWNMSDAIGRNQYVSGSTSDISPPLVIRRTGVYRVVARGQADFGIPVPSSASGPSSGDVCLVLTINSSIASSAGPFGGPVASHNIATWPVGSSDDNFAHHGVTVQRFDAGDIVRVYMGVLSSGGRRWTTTVDFNFLGTST